MLNKFLFIFILLIKILKYFIFLINMGTLCCFEKKNSTITQAGKKEYEEVYIPGREEVSSRNKINENESQTLGLKDLELKSTKYYKEKIGLSP